MLAVPLVEVQLPGAVHDQRESSQEPAVVQGLHADQALDHLSAQAARDAGGTWPRKWLSVSEWARLSWAADASRLRLARASGLSSSKRSLPPGAELDEEDHQAHPGEELAAIDAALLVACVDHGLEPLPQLREEVGDGPGQLAPSSRPSRRAGLAPSGAAGSGPVAVG